MTRRLRCMAGIGAALCAITHAPAAIDQVRATLTLKLGNSDDAYMPHLHYQLTTGPLNFASDGLLPRFENLPDKTFTRGTYFTAK